MNRKAASVTVVALFACGLWAPGCVESTERGTDLFAEEDYGPFAPEGSLPIASGTVSPDEADALRAGFDWNDTVALPETEPDGSPAVFYALVQITSRDQTELLTAGMIPWDIIPMFASERAAWTGPGVFMPGDGGHGTFVFTFLPGASYNVARTAALAGDPLFDLIALRVPPPDAVTHADGSLDLEWLASQGFCWPGLCADTSRTSTDETAVSQEELFEVLRDAADAFVRSGEAVGRAIEEFFGFLWGSVTPTAAVTLTVRMTSPDADFSRPVNASLLRTWGPLAGSRLAVAGTQVIARRTDVAVGASWSATMSATNTAAFTLPRGGVYFFCVRTQVGGFGGIGGALVTPELLPSEVCTGTFTVGGGVATAAFTAFVRDVRLQDLAVALDGVAYFSSQQIFVRPPIILVGNLANLLSAGTAFTIGLGGREPGELLASTALDAGVFVALDAGISVFGIPGGASVVAPVVAIALAALKVDIVMPDVAHPSRIVIAHEFGHHAFYQMMLHSGPPELHAEHMFTIYFLTVLGGAIPPGADPLVINEAIADLIGNQLSGGANRLIGAATASTYAGDSVGGVELYCSDTVPGCFDTNLVGTETGPLLGVRTSWIATTLFDFIDDAPGTVAHDGAVWPSANTLCPPGMARCPRLVTPIPRSFPTVDDDLVGVPPIVLAAGIASWNGLGGGFDIDTFMHGMTRGVRAAGVSDAAICGVYIAHSATAACDPNWTAP